ncbi:MAG: Lipoprotein-releasing system transmembrane protein LolE [Candidatus Accumulibacter phosphatis]|uniref:Lipoprotein-releasing system transmembrane protein LolE n=1 Tax=Candidatus Accumulibacter phosphatis TaxID=327160 RepID=A0A080M2B2_9PROT|nr:FtsX-like permease family protein [Accumulibacter sp.]KFB71294.1 MAG: Lipoprotein-releasing system transmembrane protein LolE [Candidatus Accumulibacter phosphatis]
MHPYFVDAFLALRNVMRQKRRSLVAISAVCFGVVALMLAGGFIEWIFQAMREDTIHSHLGHAQIVRPGYLDSGMADPFAFLLPDAPDERKAIETLPHVRSVAPRLSFSGLISHGDSTISFVADGVDPERETLLSRTLLISKGEGLSSGDPQGIIVGEGLAANLGVTVGDRVVLLANTASGGINAVDARVRGLFSTVTKAYDDSALRLPLPVAQQLLRVAGAHRWLVLLDDTAYTERLVGELRQRLAQRKLEVVPWTQLADFYNKTVDLFSKQVGVMKFIIAVIIVLSISNTLMMSVMERTSEIGTAMALGYDQKAILRLFVSEAALLGFFGGVLGVVVGVILALVISAIGIPMPPPPGMARGFTGEIHLTGRLIFDALTLAFGTTLVASVYPARKASQLEIVNALRRSR